MVKAKPKLIPVEEARRQWNRMSRNEREYVENKIKAKIHRKDVGQTSRYYYGNLYPKTMTAIRRYLSRR